MSIIGNPITLGGGAFANINVSGLLQTDSVVATKGSKSKSGVWKYRPGLVGIIPTMTSNTTPSGVASSSSEYSSYLAYKAFDGDSSTFTFGSGTTYPWNLTYEFPSVTTINKISIKWNNFTSQRAVTFNYKFQVSTDGNTWTDVTSTITKVKSENTNIESEEYTITETSAKYVRLVDISNTSSQTENTSMTVYELQAYNYQSVGYFEIGHISELGTWTVTATSGSTSKSISVNVDAITDYDVIWDWYTYLYNLGDECEDLTGGWEINTAVFNTFTRVNAVKESSDIKIASAYGSTSTFSGVVTANKVNLANYSKLYINYNVASVASTPNVLLGIGDSKDMDARTAGQLCSYSSGDHTEYLDISSYTGEYYIANLALTSMSGRSITEYLYKIWLEE